MAASHTACIKDVMISLKRSELDVIPGISQSLLSVHHCLLVLVVPQLMTVGPNINLLHVRQSYAIVSG